jgi:hypothetical protein
VLLLPVTPLDASLQCILFKSDACLLPGPLKDTLTPLTQVMLWERKLLLEKEMRDVLDPTVGQDVVGEMRREIHRMQLRHGELMRLQDKLMAVGE